MQKGFLYIFFSHTGFFPKILIFFAIYTGYVLDQSGRSAGAKKQKGNTFFGKYNISWFALLLHSWKILWNLVKPKFLSDVV